MNLHDLDQADLGGWIVTASGKKFSFVNVSLLSIDVEDIATALSKEPRFGGHTHGFYSVAQHSIVVSHLVPPGYELEGLLHDAHEAYVKDIPTPLKRLVPGYVEIQDRVDQAIRAKYGLSMTLSPAVKAADRLALLAERRDLLPDHLEWPIVPVNVGLIRPAYWNDARVAFLKRFEELTAKHKVAA